MGAPVVVTFRVAGTEEYKIRLTDPADIDIARKLLAGEEAPRIPNGECPKCGSHEIYASEDGGGIGGHDHALGVRNAGRSRRPAK